MRIVCDIDGCLANVVPLVQKYLPDWDEYFKHQLEAKPIEEMCLLIGNLMDEGDCEIHFITGRPEKLREVTTKWLDTNIPSVTTLFPPHELIMRSEKEHRFTYEVKLEYFNKVKPDLIIEDEPRVVKAAKELGYTVLQVHGYRITEEDGTPYQDKVCIKKF